MCTQPLVTIVRVPSLVPLWGQFLKPLYWLHGRSGILSPQ